VTSRHSNGKNEVPEVPEEPHQIAERAGDVGVERLKRAPLEVLLTAVIGGGEVSIGALGAMTVLGAALAVAPGLELYTGLALAAMAFPIGFMFVIMGHSELFTENFLIPVVAVLKRERQLSELAELWALSLAGNLVGCVGMALLLVGPGAIGEPIRHGYSAYAEHKLSVQPLGVFLSAVLAGGVMTTLTWLLLSLQDALARMLAIFAAGYLLFAANLAHSIVSASVLLVGYSDTGHPLTDVIVWLLIATAGNMVGGVGLVTLFRVAQAHQQADRVTQDK
jgi:formate/nitrite transporter FocA (FNT family)